MGFRKFANSSVVKPFVNAKDWDKIRLAGNVDFENRIGTKVVLQEYDPKHFLLSHCTIVASVDTEESCLPTGRQMFEGQQVDRRYSDFLITPETTNLINNNFDSFERKLLLSSFRTFIGAESYLEHIQIPELSKGKVIDAVARDLGNSVYVDILVANDRRHKPLVAAIESGELTTLSMGASVLFTQCSKCGNVADDELQLCNHIRYFKGNDFFDAAGKKRKIAELCGSVKVPNSVKFIEASWVGNPAFTGAVLRSILKLTDLTPDLQRRIQTAYAAPTQVFDPNVMQKAAFVMNPTSVDTGDLITSLARAQSQTARVVDTVSNHRQQKASTGIRDLVETVTRVILAQQQGQDQFPMDQQTPSQGQTEEKKSPLEGVSEELYKSLVDNVVDRVKTNLKDEEGSKVRKVIDENRNENLIRSALKSPSWQRCAKNLVKMTGSQTLAKRLFEGLVIHRHGGWEAVRDSKKFSGRDIMALSMVIDRTSKKASIAGISRIYRTAMAVGGTKPYQNVDAYLAACRRVVGRELTKVEKHELVLKGKLFSLGS